MIVAKNYFEDIPLIIAANRDEFLTRKTDLPSIINHNPIIFAPRDKLKLGTFLGINEWGVVAVITNISGIVPKDTNKKSRGHLVVRALGSPNTDRILKDFEYINFSEYNYFQLLVADRNRAVLIRYKGSIEINELQNGIFTFSNWDEIPKVADYKSSLVMSNIDRIDKNADIETVIKKLTDILASHTGEDMRFQICVHTDNYGTLSSSIIAPFQREPLFYYSIGPVCQNKFRSYSEDIRRFLKG